jgi:FKBP12-rapamycin complex-associated protein
VKSFYFKIKLILYFYLPKKLTAIIEAEILAELEEVLKYKQSPGRRDWFEDIWWRRLQGCERSFEYWHRLLLVRAIVLPKERDIRTWLKFATLCQKTNHISLAQQILNSLLFASQEPPSQQAANASTAPATSLTSTRDFELCKYVHLKSVYANGSKQDAYDKLSMFVANNLREQLEQIQRFQRFQQQQQQQAGIAVANAGGPGMNLVQLQQQQQQQQQFPQYFNLLNQRDIQQRRSELEIQLAKCYLKLGQWCYQLEGFEPANMSPVIQFYDLAKTHNQDSYKAWQAWSYANYEAIKYYRNTANGVVDAAQAANRNVYVKSAIQGFFTCIKLSAASSNSIDQEANCLQDTLRLLTLWFDHCTTAEVHDVVSEGIRHTPIDIWLQVIPQLIARIDTNKQYVARLIHNLLTEIGRVHPQALVYRLILASKVSSVHSSQQNIQPNGGGGGAGQSTRMLAALRILQTLRENNNTLVEQAKLVSEELIRVAILWNEMWHESLEEASKLYFGERNVNAMLETLEDKHSLMDRGATTNKESTFLHTYGRDLNEAREFCRRFRVSRNARDIELAWEKYYSGMLLAF